MSVSESKGELLERIRWLKNSDVAEVVKQRIKEFKSFNEKSSKEWFSEMCFCILTANSSAELGMKIQDKYGLLFFESQYDTLKNILKAEGHRFYNKRAEFICSARRYGNIKEIISRFRSGKEAREWLVGHIKGLGYKEASHFLRNVGFDDVAILDRHIMRILEEHNLIGEIRTLTKRRYLEIERILEKIAKDVGLTLAELDLYLWYIKTGQILK
jgi:N-glycosylase/DNA lyase